jgi:hypothetical protein
MPGSIGMGPDPVAFGVGTELVGVGPSVLPGVIGIAVVGPVGLTPVGPGSIAVLPGPGSIEVSDPDGVVELVAALAPSPSLSPQPLNPATAHPDRANNVIALLMMNSSRLRRARRQLIGAVFHTQMREGSST